MKSESLVLGIKIQLGYLKSYSTSLGFVFFLFCRVLNMLLLLSLLFWKLSRNEYTVLLPSDQVDGLFNNGFKATVICLC